NIEQKPAILVVDGEVAIAGIQRDGIGDLILKRAQHLPVDVGDEPEAADVALGLERESAAQFDPAGDADDRIDPGLVSAALSPSEGTCELGRRVHVPE